MNLSRYFVRKSVATIQEEAGQKDLKRTLSALNLVSLGIGCIIGAGILVFAETATADSSSVVIIPVCSASSRMVFVDPTANGDQMHVHASCNNDKNAGMAEEYVSASLPFKVEAAKLHSIHFPRKDPAFDVSSTVGYHRQTVVIRRADGQSCASIVATTQHPKPEFKRFIAENGDWGSSVDYLIDDHCSMIMIELGNRLAVVQAGRQSFFNLYGIHFAVAP